MPGSVMQREGAYESSGGGVVEDRALRVDQFLRAWARVMKGVKVHGDVRGEIRILLRERAMARIQQEDGDDDAGGA